MVRKIFSMMLGLALLALPTFAQAGFLDSVVADGTSINKLSLANFEAVIRGDVANNNYQVLTASDTVLPDDYVVSLFRANALSVGSSQNWAPVANDFVLGYSVQKIASIDVTTHQFTYANPGVDPAGILASNEMVKFFTSTTDWNVSGVFAADLVSMNTKASAGDSVSLATFALAGAPTYAVFQPFPGTFFEPLIGVGSFGLNAVNTIIPFVPAVNAGRDVQGAVTVWVPGKGEWFAGSSGVVQFAAVPEPGTLALWGGCLAIGAVVALRRRKS